MAKELNSREKELGIEFNEKYVFLDLSKEHIFSMDMQMRELWIAYKMLHKSKILNADSKYESQNSFYHKGYSDGIVSILRSLGGIHENEG